MVQQHRSRHRRQRWWAGLGGLVLVMGAVFAVRYPSVEPTFSNPCGGLVAGDFEVSEAAGATEYEVPHRPGERFGVLVCPVTDGNLADLTITNMTVGPLGEPQFSGVAFVGASNNVGQPQAWSGDASTFEPYATHQPQRPVPRVLLWFETTGCNGAGAVSWDDARIHYRWRGRDRVSTIELGSQISVVFDQGCTALQRSEVGLRDDAFRTALPPSNPPTDGVLPSHDNRTVAADVVGNDLCRYLEGVRPPSDERLTPPIEPLERRLVFRVPNRQWSSAVADAAITELCPEHLDRRDEVLGLLATQTG